LVDAHGPSGSTSASSVPDRIFTTPNLTLSLTSGPAGTIVTISGVGFKPFETGIYITWDSVALPTALMADAAGAWIAYLVVPTTTGGIHIVDAYGAYTPAAQVPNQTFTVTPGVTVTGTGSRPGETVTVTGTGFGVLETGIVVTWDGVVVGTVGTASSTGGWTFTLTIPNSVTGAHLINAYGSVTSAGSAANATLIVAPGLTMSLASGAVGTLVTVNGSGFYGGETGIQVLWNGAAIKTGLAADATGSWSTTFNVPAAPSGGYPVGASGALTLQSQVPAKTFTVVRAVSLDPASGYAGGVVNVTGAGFAANSAVAITYDGTAVTTTPASIVSTASGNVSGSFTVPLSGPGVHTVVFSDSQGTLSVSFTITSSVSSTLLSGTVGAQTTLNGLGFPPNAAVAFAFDNAAVATTPASVTTGSNGAFSATLTIPDAARGAHTIKVSSGATVLTMTFVVSPSVSISPVSGYVGQAVSVNGAGFAANSVVSITYDGTAVTTVPASMTSTASGKVSASFAVPSSGPGIHTVVFNDGQGTLGASFTITAAVSSTTLSGAVGAQPILSGLGFPPNAAVVFAFDNAAVATAPASVTTGSNGAFSATLTIPDAARGTHMLKAVSGATVVSISFEISPKLSSSPDSGAVGTPVTLTGKGFGGGEPIVFTIDGVAVTSTPLTVTAAAEGSFSATLTLPALAGGPHVIRAADRAASAQVSLTVTSKVVTGVTAVKVGDKINAVGSGFPAGGVVIVAVDGAATTTSPAPLVANAQGTFTVDVTIPAAAFGSHTMTFASGSSVSQATISVASTFAISPSNGNVGSVMTVSGAGYAAGSAISITYDGAALATIPSPLAATSAGSFQATVVIPRSLHGQHVVAASDAAGHSLPASFNMESVPPPAPYLLSPPTGTRLGTFVAEKPAFNWGPMFDVSGVTFTLEVSRDPGFAASVVVKNDLAANSYQLAGDEKIGRGYYYWRVKAVDGASNESGWSQVFTLKIGILPVWMPMWMFIAFIVIGLGIIAGLVYLFGFSKIRIPFWGGFMAM